MRRMNLLDKCRQLVRDYMTSVARFLNYISGGAITPSMITITGLLAHLPIAWLISQGYFGYAAAGLVVFGLFDALDGALARVQNRASNAGMLLDATTDRMKEIILYVGVAFVFVRNSSVVTYDNLFLALVVAACGGSLLVSYVKAKGETAVRDTKISPNEVNRLFADGFMRYEVRMLVLIIGLLTDTTGLMTAILFIAVLSWLTAFGRLWRIMRKLGDVQS